MDLHEALYTTRAMRRVSKDPIPTDVQARIVDAAIRAPSGGNTQHWRFLLVDDRDVKVQLGAVYRRCLDHLWSTFYRDRVAAAEASPDDPESRSFLQIKRSADHLAEHFEDYPLLLFGFAQHDPTGSAIFPAIWNAMLAARGEGVGSALTSALQFESEEALRILGVPEGEGWLMACCVTFGYPTGRWGVAERVPVESVTFSNQWGTPLPFEVNGPLYP